MGSRYTGALRDRCDLTAVFALLKLYGDLVDYASNIARMPFNFDSSDCKLLVVLEDERPSWTSIERDVTDWSIIWSLFLHPLELEDLVIGYFWGWSEFTYVDYLHKLVLIVPHSWDNFSSEASAHSSAPSSV